MNKEALEFLSIIGVDVRFISFYNEFIFINNLKFSRFSRKKEELFLNKFPDRKVIRSKIFQKMCIKASRILSKSLNPQDKIFILKNSSCADLTLFTILEPYARKYGIEIIYEDDFSYAENCEVDSVASSLTLDDEVENILDLIIKGERIQLKSLKTDDNGMKVIHPLIDIPDSWIRTWTQKYGLSCIFTDSNVKNSEDLIAFLEGYVPNVRENILKSALFLSKVN